jgi:soluble lytic murein transglycosylase-like protein
MRDNHARLVGCRSSVPPSILPSRPCSSIRRRSSGLQRKSHALEPPRSTAWPRSRQAIARIILAIAPILCQIAVSAVFVPRAGAQIATHSESINRFAEFIAEASVRFAVPERWIRAVMQVESGGAGDLVSRRHRFDATYAWHLGGTQRSLWARAGSLRSSRQHLGAHRLPQGDA